MANPTEAKTLATEVSKDQPSPLDGCLRVLHNRIRNLKKQIDKASGYEEAERKGEPLNDEQKEVIKNKPMKVGFLKELEELKRRQEIIVEKAKAQDFGKAVVDPTAEVRAPAQNEDATGKKKKSKKKKKRKAAPDTTSTIPGADPVHEDVTVRPNPSIALAEESMQGAVREHRGSGKNGPPDAQPEPELRPERELEPQSESQRESVATATFTDSIPQSASTIGHNACAGVNERKNEPAPFSVKPEAEIRADATSKILELMHIIEFLRQEPNASETLLSHAENVSSEELEFVLYFGVMLTTPNGNVPHHEAVEVSSTHCRGYLDRSDEEAFTGVKYSDLVRIVRNIAASPLLKDRGLHNTPDAEEVL